MVLNMPKWFLRVKKVLNFVQVKSVSSKIIIYDVFVISHQG